VLAARLPHSHTGTRQVRHYWRQLDLERLKCDVLQSTLVADPPPNVDDFFACYNDVPRSLLDKHVPVKSVVVRRRLQSPWFDGECRDMKLSLDAGEIKYCTTYSSADYNAWRRQLNSQRAFFQTKYAEFWTSAVAESGHDSRALWSATVGTAGRSNLITSHHTKHRDLFWS